MPNPPFYYPVFYAVGCRYKACKSVWEKERSKTTFTSKAKKAKMYNINI